MPVGHAAEFPERLLQAEGKALKALGKADRAGLPVGAGQHEVVEQVGEGPSSNRHVQPRDVGTAPSRSQSSNPCRSGVVVPKVRGSCCTGPCSGVWTRQAVRRRLCTSKAAQQGYSSSIGSSISGTGTGRTSALRTLLCVLSRHRGQQGWVLPEVPVQLLFRLAAPVTRRPQCRQGNDTSVGTLVPHSVHSFSCCWASQRIRITVLG